MRVLLITGSFPPMKCGVGDYTESLARGLAQHPGMEVAVLTDRQAAERKADEPYRTYAVIDEWRGREYPKVDSVLREFEPDIVHIQYPTLGYRNDLAWLLPTHLTKMWVPVVQTWHEYFPNETGASWREFRLALSRGGVIVVRPNYLRNMPWWYRLLIAHKRVEFIPNAPSIPKVNLSPEQRAEIKARYAPPGRSLVTFFGFMYEHKGVDDLLQAVDPERHHVLLLGQPRPEDPYQANLFERISKEPLSRFVTLGGFMPSDEVAKILAASDAVALPYRKGGGMWNTSIHAAVLQGTFTLTTSFEQQGYDPQKNIYYAQPGSVAELRTALKRHIGTRNLGEREENLPPTWEAVVDRHLAFYRRYL